MEDVKQLAPCTYISEDEDEYAECIYTDIVRNDAAKQIQYYYKKYTNIILINKLNQILNNLQPDDIQFAFNHWKNIPQPQPYIRITQNPNLTKLQEKSKKNYMNAANKIIDWWKNIYNWQHILNVGDYIDCYDTESAIWREAIVIKKKHSRNEPLEPTLKIHFISWNNKWDQWFYIKTNYIAKYHTKTIPWKNTLCVGDYIEYTRRYNLEHSVTTFWYKGQIIKILPHTDMNTTYIIKDINDNHLNYYKTADSEYIAQKGTHIMNWNILHKKYFYKENIPFNAGTIRAKHYKQDAMKTKNNILLYSKYHNNDIIHISGIIWSNTNTSAYKLLNEFVKNHKINKLNYIKYSNKHKYDLVDKHICVRWKIFLPIIGNYIDQWYTGYIKSYNEIDNTHCIYYYDKQEKNTDLDTVKYNIVKEYAPYSISTSLDDEEKTYIFDISDIKSVKECHNNIQKLNKRLEHFENASL